jgi:hypothetical protein
MTPEQLASKMREARRSWIDLPDGKAVLLERPRTAEMGRFGSGVTVDSVVPLIVGWRGFTEADLLGASVGSADPAEFSTELWEEVLKDRVSYFKPVLDALVRIVSEHSERLKAIEGN